MNKLPLLLGLVLLQAHAAMAQEDGAGVKTAAAVPDAQDGVASKPKFPVGATLSLSNTLGTGAFVANAGARNVAWAMVVSVLPSLTLWEKLNLSLRVDVMKNLTTSYAGNINADLSSESYMRQMTVSDVVATANYPEIYREPITNISIGASVAGFIPTSMRSRTMTQYFALRPALALNWTWKSMTLSYGASLRKNFYASSNARLDVNNYAEPTLQYRPRGPEYIGDGLVAIGELRNINFIVTNGVNAKFAFLDDQVSITVALAILNSFKDTLPLSDEYSSENARASGQVDATAGTVEIAYKPFEHVGFALGLSSAQPAFTADNKNLRFPFFDVVSPSNNFTSVYFDVIGTL